MKNIKICTPVIGKTLNEFLKNLTLVQEVSEMIELRVDQIKNLTLNDLETIRKITNKEAILNSRNKEIIIKGFESGFDYVDIDINTIKNFKLSKSQKSKTILSFHDFEKTPNINKLTSIVNHMRECNVGVLKIATMVTSDQDITNLFQILLNKKKIEKMIIVGMGEKGKLTRILGSLLGSFLTFASTEFGSSAPGQINIVEMKTIYKLLFTNH